MFSDVLFNLTSGGSNLILHAWVQSHLVWVKSHLMSTVQQVTEVKFLNSLILFLDIKFVLKPHLGSHFG